MILYDWLGIEIGTVRDAKSLGSGIGMQIGQVQGWVLSDIPVPEIHL